MDPDELDAILGAERMCRVATLGPDGSPHNSPLWFVWDGRSLWLNSIVGSQRWANIERDSRGERRGRRGAATSGSCAESS